MHPEANPFRPGRSFAPRFFSGREEELERVYRIARPGEPAGAAAGFLSGERGLGKTALARIVHRAAAREGGLIVCPVSVAGARDLDALALRIWERLLRRHLARSGGDRIHRFFGDRIRPDGRLGMCPVLRPPGPFGRSGRFAESVRRLPAAVAPEYRALLLVLDDLGELAASPDFPRWIEDTLDELDELGTPNGGFGFRLLLVGTGQERRRMIRERPALARRLESVALSPWSPGEACDFFRQTFEAGRVFLPPDHLDALVRFSAGHPRLAHEIGEAVWRAAETPNLSTAALARGVAQAADLVGLRLLEPGVFRSLRDEADRSLVRRVAEETSDTRPPGRKRRRTARKQRAYEDLLHRLEGQGALTAAPEPRFRDRLHAGFVAIESQRTAAGRLRLSAFD